MGRSRGDHSSACFDLLGHLDCSLNSRYHGGLGSYFRADAVMADLIQHRSAASQGVFALEEAS
jgi:hypothetical protein